MAKSWHGLNCHQPKYFLRDCVWFPISFTSFRNEIFTPTASIIYRALLSTRDGPVFILKVTQEHGQTLRYIFLQRRNNFKLGNCFGPTRDKQNTNKWHNCLGPHLPPSVPKTKPLCRIKVNFKAKLRKHETVEPRADSAHRVVLGYSNNWKKVQF